MKTKKKLFIIITIFLFVSMSLVITLNVVRSQIYASTTSVQYLCPYSSYYRSVVKLVAPHIMMPAGTSAEWTSFTGNVPSVSGLTVSTIACCNDGHCLSGYTCSSGSCVSGAECSGPRDCGTGEWGLRCPLLMDCQGGSCCCADNEMLCIEEDCPPICST